MLQNHCVLHGWGAGEVHESGSELSDGSNDLTDEPDFRKMGHSRQLGPQVLRARVQDDGSYATQLL